MAANMVEGFADQSKRWRLRYLRISIGSLAEVGYGIHLARRLEYLSLEQASATEREIARVASPLHGLIARTRKEAATERRG